MSKKAFFFGLGISFSFASVLWKWSGRSPSRSLPRVRKDDLYYSHLSPEEIESRHLVDLNGASAAQLSALGLDSDALQRLLDNRPYRTKLELVSRMVIPEAVYATIKDKVEVARGDEPVKTA